MSQAFIIMQIGNPDLDIVYKSAILPAIMSCGLNAKRVDKHNEGGLLKSEIISFIQDSDIIIADLTNERPNCYLEVGYAMGVDKFKNLILTIREDHFPENPNFVRGGPKIHFDLAGYDILSWSQDALPEFEEELVKRIQRRLLIITPSSVSTSMASTWDEEWIKKHRKKAEEGIKGIDIQGFMEIRFGLEPPKLNKTQSELNEAARKSKLNTGWPIGVYLENRDGCRPHPTAEGIVAEISIGDNDKSYDYWTINKKGDFYSLIALYEDRSGNKDSLFFDRRIHRITESILFCAKLYSFLDVEKTKKINFGIRHAGLNGRTLSSMNSDRDLFIEYKAIEDQSDTEIKFSLQEIEADLSNLVKQIVTPLFTLFDFFELTDIVLEDIVNKFVRDLV
jgi:hypothetical protein